MWATPHEMGTESVWVSAPDFQRHQFPPQTEPPGSGVTSSPNQYSLAPYFYGVYLLPLAKSVDIINKENPADAKHRTNFPSPSYETQFQNPPKHLRLEKCGRVVETGPRQDGKQPVWISSAATVAPSVPTPARSSREWERFRCSWGLEERV